MWDRIRPALAPVATGTLPLSPQDLATANTSPEAQQHHHHQQQLRQKTFPLSPRRHGHVTSASTIVSDSRTSSLLQPLFSRPVATLSRRSSRHTLSPASKLDKDDGWHPDFDLLSGLGIDQAPTTRRYEIRRGVAHRVDLSQQLEQSNDRPDSSHSQTSSSNSPLKARSANVATRKDYGSTVADVSPPSSPEVASARNARLPDDQDVSPIEETHPALSQLDIARAHHQRYLEEQQREKENQAPQARSFIPTMRREKRQNQQAATATLRETKSRERLRNLSATKWDDMTGEPTATGRAGQVRPQEFAQEVGQRPQVQLRTPPAQRQDRNVVQSFGDRVRKLRSGGAAKDDVPGRPAISAPVTAPMPLDQRPGWRGASGRTTLVEPVADTTAVPPLNVPRRSSKRVSSSGFRDAAGSPPHQTPTASSHVLAAPNAAAPETPTHPGQQTPSPPPVAQSSQLGAQAYPSPPSGDDARLGPHAPAPAAKAVPDAGSHGGLGQQPTPILAVPDQQKAIRRKPPQAINPLALNKPHHNPHLSYSSSVYSPQQTPVPTEKPPAPYSEDPPVDHFAQAPAEAWIQPPSRFSVTTYATSAAAGSPRPSADSDQPPLPTPPSQFESVMDRRRPVCLGSTSPAINTDQPFKISMSSPYASSSGEASPSPTAARAQLPSQHKGIGPRGRDSGRTDSMLSMSKALPLAPPELMSANDRVAHLNARLEALGNRRININTAIKQMTELMPQDNLMASQAVLHKREAEKRKVEALRAELSDVQREEYELGLKLHRAYKRLDKNAEYEPTTLWVRRVTG